MLHHGLTLVSFSSIWKEAEGLCTQNKQRGEGEKCQEAALLSTTDDLFFFSEREREGKLIFQELLSALAEVAGTNRPAFRSTCTHTRSLLTGAVA
ncbi:hypothetical protein SKAU_G00232960 [Synaphobranchus kaupii]|uniref:Uncharacterized protein n=1 Tax=Synaphobranchus kaupii TaxID=118154 RepID=A0A9Q1ISJ2_SYNKA|nr:hypothetical protein SKAU_G00232960 [Synaphobranchus kaupii]